MAGHYMVWSVLLLLKIFCFWLVMLLTVSFLTATRCKFFFACDGPCSSGEGKSGWYGVSNHSLFLNHLLAFSFYVLKSLQATFFFLPKFLANYSVLMSCFYFLPKILFLAKLFCAHELLFPYTFLLCLHCVYPSSYSGCSFLLPASRPFGSFILYVRNLLFSNSHIGMFPAV